MKLLVPTGQPEKPLWKEVLFEKKREYEQEENPIKAAEISRDIALIERALSKNV